MSDILAPNARASTVVYMVGQKGACHLMMNMRLVLLLLGSTKYTKGDTLDLIRLTNNDGLRATLLPCPKTAALK